MDGSGESAHRMLVISSSTDARDSGEKVFFMSLSAGGKSFESATATRFKYRWFYCGGCEWLPEEHVMAPLGDMDVFVSHKITLLITVFSLQLQPQDKTYAIFTLNMCVDFQ